LSSLVGNIVTAERFSYTAIGHTAGLAQRMESLAAPGSVYLTGHAARLAAFAQAVRWLRRMKVSAGARNGG
jgi:class 3 adenylate cyclase